MTAKDKILSKLRENSNQLFNSDEVNEIFDFPDISLVVPIEFKDAVEKFKETAQNVSGAKLIEGENLNDINKIIKDTYPEAKIIGSNLPYIAAEINPDALTKVNDLMRIDVGVVEGQIGVAENGCIWIPQTMKERGVLFASEYLVIILHKTDIVNNMHEAYQIIENKPEYFDTYKFGTFISGPSKTADIESALVYGAQAARGVTVILLP